MVIQDDEIHHAHVSLNHICCDLFSSWGDYVAGALLLPSYIFANLTVGEERRERVCSEQVIACCRRFIISILHTLLDDIIIII